MLPECNASPTSNCCAFSDASVQGSSDRSSDPPSRRALSYDGRGQMAGLPPPLMKALTCMGMARVLPVSVISTINEFLISVLVIRADLTVRGSLPVFPDWRTFSVTVGSFEHLR